MKYFALSVIDNFSDIDDSLNAMILVQMLLHFTSVKFFIFIVLGHAYFVGVQFHPEFLTRPYKPSPPYLGLILAASCKLTAYLSRGCRMSPSNSLGNLFSEREDWCVTPGKNRLEFVNPYFPTSWMGLHFDWHKYCLALGEKRSIVFTAWFEILVHLVLVVKKLCIYWCKLYFIVCSVGIFKIILYPLTCK